METITLTFGTQNQVMLSVSSIPDNYEKQNLLPIVMEEDGFNSYAVNIFGADNLRSVFPIFKATETSCFKFGYNGRISTFIKVLKDAQISSFPNQNETCNLEIYNEKNGYSIKNTLIVWFGVLDEIEYEIYIGTNLRRNFMMLCHPEYNVDCSYEPRILNKRSFHFGFKNLQ
jgi:hypothetical protein